MLNLMRMTVLAAVVKTIPSRDHPEKCSRRIGCFQHNGDKGKNNSYDNTVDRSQKKYGKKCCQENIEFIAADPE